MIGSYYDAQCAPRTFKERRKKNGTVVKLETIMCRFDPAKKVYFLLERCAPSSTLQSDISDDTREHLSAEQRANLSNAMDYHSFIAHEVRNPLAGIDSTAQLMIMTNLLQ